MPVECLFDFIDGALQVWFGAQLADGLIDLCELLHQLCLEGFFVILRRSLKLPHCPQLDQL